MTLLLRSRIWRMVVCWCLYQLALLIDPVGGQSIYNRLNPITYYGFTQPYLSGFYGGIGGMPYMSSWQASMYQGTNPYGALGMMGIGAYGMGGGGFGSWNAATPLHSSSSLFLLSCIFSSVFSLVFWRC